MYKLAFFVPESHLEVVKQALFQTGAGRIGNYAQCCWQTLGEGQFLPLQGSTPYSGQVGQAQTADEYKVELVCEDALIEVAIRALKAAHPYETPAYEAWKLADL